MIWTDAPSEIAALADMHVMDIKERPSIAGIEGEPDDIVPFGGRRWLRLKDGAWATSIPLGDRWRVQVIDGAGMPLGGSINNDETYEFWMWGVPKEGGDEENGA